ncbi:hypothetical protein DFP72DRAFT_985160 [Ephemerocybe angulata]|uniref:Hyaluronan/mRNA-binding protein domain-containing protein n=1 Tax=Ephemerocybe angulata TaxID=980116 RepID=A0A8H6IK04_9AGAR|nr:hypothetical protein DFP72DRAFT_985160 [Tulosesus angulatus]
MSVASKNPFSLLDGKSPPRSPPASCSSPAPKAAAPAAPAPAAPRAQQKPRATPASRGGKYYARGGKPGPKDGAAAPAAEDAPVDGQKKTEGGRGARGGSRGRGAPRGGRRPFDKHSATGKTDSQKKVHQGWGGDEGNTELKTEQAAEADATAEVTTPVEGEAAPAEGATTPRRAAREEEEEEDNTLTLEQYLAQQKTKETTVPKIEATRQANEGAGEEIWKDAVALAKDEEESYFVGKSKSAPKPKAKKEEKVFLEIDARFERPDRGGAGRGRGRGDRGGDRAPRGTGERRGRGAPRAPRGGRQNGAAATPNVDDQTAFPSLA